VTPLSIATVEQVAEVLQREFDVTVRSVRRQTR
jgi:hypothetical protein